MSALGVVSASLLLVASSIARAAGDGAFVIEPGEFRLLVRKVAIGQIALPAEADVEAFHAVLQDRLETTFENVGIDVAEPDLYTTAWREASLRAGGTFHPGTGERLEIAAAVWEHVTRHLALAHDVDAIVDAWISCGEGDLYGDREARYLEGGERIGDVRTDPQRIDVSFLTVRIRNMGGSTLYSKRSPIEWSRIYARRSLEERPADALLVDPRRWQQAVARTVDPLLQLADR